MSRLMEEDKELNAINYVETPLAKGIYENYAFNRCIFTNSDLSNIIFVECEFVECDLRRSFNLSIDPELNRIRRAKFSAEGITGLLDKYDLTID